MMKSNVQALLLSMGLLISTSNANVETNSMVPPVLETLETNQKSPLAVLNPAIMPVLAELSAMVRATIHDVIEQSAILDATTFNHARFSQLSDEKFPALKQKIIARLDSMSIDKELAEQKELADQVELFMIFIKNSVSLFVQENAMLPLDLMEATTQQDALTIIKPIDSFIEQLPEQFAQALMAGTIKTPDIAPPLSEAELARLLSEILHRTENVMLDSVADCTDENDMFNGKLYVQNEGLVTQKISILICSFISSLYQQGIAKGDWEHVAEFLTQALPQAELNFNMQNPDFDIKLANATTEAEAMNLVNQYIATWYAAQEQYLNENFPASQPSR